MPLDEMTMAGMRDCVSCFDSALDSMARKRVVQNAHIRRSCSAWTRRFCCGSCAVSSCGAFSSRFSGCSSGIELVDALLVARERLERHGAVEEHRQHRNALLLFEPADPVQDFLDPADGERRDDQLAAAFRGLAYDRSEILAVVVDLVDTIAIGRLDEQVIGTLDADGIR